MGEPNLRNHARHIQSQARGPQSLFPVYNVTLMGYANTIKQSSRRFVRSGRLGRRKRKQPAKPMRSVSALRCQVRMAMAQTDLEQGPLCSCLPSDISQAHIPHLPQLAYNRPWTGTTVTTCTPAMDSQPRPTLHRISRCTISVSIATMVHCVSHIH